MMKRVLTLLVAFLTFLAPVSASAAGEVWVLELTGAISPASSDFVVRNLEKARDQRAALFVIQMDTPGGLDSSMRAIIKAILASDIPVATYVAPDGSRAASAGTYILYASHIAAMAPATNVGSSTPVSIGGSPFPSPSPAPSPSPPATPKPSPQGVPDATTPDGSSDQPDAAAPADRSSGDTAMERKIINDAIAYLKSLAELRGRNADFALRTVRDGKNVPASEALSEGIIDMIAVDLDELLEKLDGRVIKVNAHTNATLATKGVPIVRVQPDWRNQFLAFITDPNVAYLLMMIGVYGLILEFYSPGLGIAGISGIICLMLGFYALQMLPVSYAGLGLMFLGIALMVGEAFTPSFGVLGVGGGIAFVIGSIMLMDTDLPGFQISMSIIVATALVSFGIVVLSIGGALRMRGVKIVAGSEAISGASAEALESFQGLGRVRAFGEVWQAKAETPVQKGQLLHITGRDGLILTVAP